MSQYLSFNQQIQDMALWAQSQGYKFVIYVREGASVTSGIQKAEASGLLSIEYFPFP